MRAGRTVMCPPQPSVPHLYVSLIMISYHCARLLLFEYPEKLIDALYRASRSSALRSPGQRECHAHLQSYLRLEEVRGLNDDAERGPTAPTEREE